MRIRPFLSFQRARIRVALSIIVLLILFIFWLLCYHQSESNRQPVAARQPADGKLYSSEERRLERQALLGSKDAAASLILKFTNCASLAASRNAASQYPTGSVCEQEMQRWSQIGAENGDKGAMLAKVDQLLAEPSCSNGLRAKYWLSKTVQTERDRKIFGWRHQAIEKLIRACPN